MRPIPIPIPSSASVLFLDTQSCKFSMMKMMALLLAEGVLGVVLAEEVIAVVLADEDLVVHTGSNGDDGAVPLDGEGHDDHLASHSCLLQPSNLLLLVLSYSVPGLNRILGGDDQVHIGIHFLGSRESS